MDRTLREMVPSLVKVLATAHMIPYTCYILVVEAAMVAVSDRGMASLKDK
jgi:hypothetical protein